MTRPTLVIDVRGERAPKGSKVALGRSKKGKTILKESSDKLPMWYSDIKAAAEKVMSETGGWDEPFDGPVVATMTFYFYRPKKHFRTGKNSHLLRGDAPLRPIGIPDVDKLERAVNDSLTGAGVWYDDGQLVCSVANKCYTSDAHPFQGALITVSEYVE